MFDTIDGLPVHALVVHAVTVLVPLTVLGTIAIAVRPNWRSRFGTLLLGIAVVATIACPIATASGESLERRVGEPGVHAQLGDQLVWFVLPLTVLIAVLVVLDHRGRSAGARPRRALTTVVAAVAIVAAVAAGVQVYRVGESGARAVWADQMS